MILVVEDDENDVVLLRHELEAAKLQNPLTVCTDGEMAIHYLDGRGKFADRNKFPLPVVILLDLKLPRRSGAEVLAWIEGRRQLHSIPVVAITAQTDPKQLAQISHLGAVTILAKPIRGPALMDRLRQMKKFRWEKTTEGETLQLLVV